MHYLTYCFILAFAVAFSAAFIDYSVLDYFRDTPITSGLVALGVLSGIAYVTQGKSGFAKTLALGFVLVTTSSMFDVATNLLYDSAGDSKSWAWTGTSFLMGIVCLCLVVGVGELLGVKETIDTVQAGMSVTGYPVPIDQPNPHLHWQMVINIAYCMNCAQFEMAVTLLMRNLMDSLDPAVRVAIGFMIGMGLMLLTVAFAVGYNPIDQKERIHPLIFIWRIFLLALSSLVCSYSDAFWLWSFNATTSQYSVKVVIAFILGIMGSIYMIFMASAFEPLTQFIFQHDNDDHADNL